MARNSNKKYFLSKENFDLLNNLTDQISKELNLDKNEVIHQFSTGRNNKKEFMPQKEVLGISESTFNRLRNSKEGVSFNSIQTLKERLNVFEQNDNKTFSISSEDILNKVMEVGTNIEGAFNPENLPDGIRLHQICFKINFFLQIQDYFKNISFIKNQITEHIKEKRDVGDSYFKATFNPSLVEETFRNHSNLLDDWLEKVSKLTMTSKKNLTTFVKNLVIPTISEEYYIIRHDEKKLKTIFGLLLSNLYFQKLTEVIFDVDSYIENFYFKNININNIHPENPIYGEFAICHDSIYKAFIQESPINKIIKILNRNKKNFSVPTFDKVPQELISNNLKSDIIRKIDVNIKTIENDILYSLDSYFLSTDLLS